MADTFAAAGEAALAHLNSSADQTADTTPVADPSPAAPVSADPAAPTAPVAGDPAVPGTPQTFKVKTGGQELDVQLDELLNGYSRHSDYTKKTMELAEQRRQFDAAVQQAQEREVAINTFLKDANQVAQYYQHLTGQQIAQLQQQQQQAPQVDPNEIATIGQTSQMLRQAQAELQQQVKQVERYTQEQLNVIHQAEQQKRASAIDSDITGTIKGILADERFKVLSAIDDVSEVLCADAMKLHPANIAEAKQAILQVAQARTEKMQAHFNEMLKASALKQTKLTNNGIEPPGGSGVTPAPTQHKLGSKDLTDAATTWLQSRLNK